VIDVMFGDMQIFRGSSAEFLLAPPFSDFYNIGGEIHTRK